MPRYFITFAYNGTSYCGWQSQPNGTAVQEVLEKAMTTIMRRPMSVTGAGRTDTGVHALNMVAHFDIEEPITDTDKLVNNLNSLLPYDIAVRSVRRVSDDAHARFDALSRRYEYHVVLRKDPFLKDQACRLHYDLDVSAMNKAADLLFEYVDFTSFSKLHTDAKTNNCTIMKAYWEWRGDRLVFTIKANRFLRNMVRAIVGTLFEVGRGHMSLQDFRNIIEAKDRCRAGHSVPASGLYFIEAEYPESVEYKE